MPLSVFQGARRVWHLLQHVSAEERVRVLQHPERALPPTLWLGSSARMATNTKNASYWLTFVRLLSSEASTEFAAECVARWSGRTTDREQARERGERAGLALSAGKRTRVRSRSVWPVERLVIFLLRMWSPTVPSACDVTERLAGSAMRREWLNVIIRLWTMARPIDVALMRWSAVVFLGADGVTLTFGARESWESVLSRCARVSLVVLSAKTGVSRRLVLPALAGPLRALCVVQALSDYFSWWGVSPSCFAANSSTPLLRSAAASSSSSSSSSSSVPFLLFPLQNQAVSATRRALWPWPVADVLQHARSGLSSDCVSNEVAALLRRAQVAGPTTDVYPNLSYSLRAAFASWLLASGVASQRVMDWGGWQAKSVVLSHYACERVAVDSPAAVAALSLVRASLAEANNMSWV